MRKYETVFIIHPDLSQEARQPLLDKLKNLVSDGHGLFVKFEEWGHKKLSYQLDKHTGGYYTLMEFCGNGALVKELERTMRLDDRILKYMTVLLDKKVDLEALKAEIEAAKREASKQEMAQNVPPPEDEVLLGAEATGPDSQGPAQTVTSNEKELPSNDIV